MEPPLDDFRSQAEQGRVYDDAEVQRRAEEVSVWDSLQEMDRGRRGTTIECGESEMSTGFEIWDSTTHNSLQFDQLEEAIVALRGLVERNGAGAVDGLSLDAVTDDGGSRITIAEEDGLLSLISATAAAR